MFPRSYFAGNYFAPTYFPGEGGEGGPLEPAYKAMDYAINLRRGRR